MGRSSGVFCLVIADSFERLAAHSDDSVMGNDGFKVAGSTA